MKFIKAKCFYVILHPFILHFYLNYLFFYYDIRFSFLQILIKTDVFRTEKRID